jgi:hypothetical protein
MAATENRTNGRDPGHDQHVRDRLRRLNDIGDVGNIEHPAGTYSRKTRDAAGPAHDRERHPEDMPGALHETAREVCDPESMRVGFVDTGKSCQALDPEVFEPLIDEVVDGITGVRAGAIIGPAQVAAGERLKIVESTQKEIAQLVSDRAANGMKAARLEKDEVPRRREAIAKQEIDVGQNKAAEEAAQARLVVERAKGFPRDWRSGDLLHWVALSPLGGLTLAVVALFANTILLQAPLSSAVNVSEVGSYALAGGLSLTFEFASAAAGYVFASLRLPARVAGTVFVGLFALIMYKLVGGLDALREYKASGVETLTAATLASCFVAGLTGYAMATWNDFHHHRELVLAAGTALGDALGLRDMARELRVASDATLAEMKHGLNELYAEIETLRDSAARADAAAAGRGAEGIKAEVEVDTISAVANTQVNQEKAANGRWGKAVALLAYYKARAEKLPLATDIQLPIDHPTAVTTGEGGLTGLQKAAIAALAAGAAGGVIVGPLVLAVGAGLAAILLLPFPRIWHGFGRRRASDAVVPPEMPPINSQADHDNPMYLHQPDHMVAKYRRGGPSSGERQ